MLKAFVFGLIGLGLSLNPSFASNLKIGSWGGNVRSGPSTDYTRIGSLREGDPVVLLEKIKSSGSKLNWFKIAYGKGKVGYQWGGILCGFDKEVNGTFGVCEKDNRSSPRRYRCSDQNQLRSLGAKRDTKITFFVGQTAKDFNVYWIDYNGNEQFYQRLSSGMSWTVDTYSSHPWIVYKLSKSGDETCHSVVRGTKRPSQWLLR